MCWRAARGLPRCEEDDVLLSVPDIRQRDEHDCGDAALEMVCAFIGVKVPKSLKLANPVQGMALETMEAALRALGLRVNSGHCVLGVADLQHYTRAGLPVLCPITVDSVGHWVVVTGVARKRVHFNDPSWRGPRSLPFGEWLDCWRDYSRPGLTLFDRWGIVAARE